MGADGGWLEMGQGASGIWLMAESSNGSGILFRHLRDDLRPASRCEDPFPDRAAGCVLHPPLAAHDFNTLLRHAVDRHASTT